MFIVVSQIIPEGENPEKALAKTLASFRKDKIYFLFIPANNEKVHGRILVRHIGTAEFTEHFKQTIEATKEFKEIDHKIKQYLKKHNISISDNRLESLCSV